MASMWIRCALASSVSALDTRITPFAYPCSVNSSVHAGNLRKVDWNVPWLRAGFGRAVAPARLLRFCYLGRPGGPRRGLSDRGFTLAPAARPYVPGPPVPNSLRVVLRDPRPRSHHLLVHRM